MTDADYELVPVAAEILYEVLNERPRPVVLMGFTRLEDGSVELHMQKTDLTLENERLREALESIRCYAGEGPHQSLGEACGIDACTGCLIHATAEAALLGRQQ